MRIIALLAALVSLAAAPARAADLTVPIDQTARISLGGSAASVFVGNGSIVDALIVDRRNLVLVGRGYGKTSVLVLDGAGRTLLNQSVLVSPADHGRMTLYRGVQANNFSCSPTCERTPMPGEEQGSFAAYNGPYQAYQGRAQSGDGGAAPE